MSMGILSSTVYLTKLFLLFILFDILFGITKQHHHHNHKFTKLSESYHNGDQILLNNKQNFTAYVPPDFPLYDITNWTSHSNLQECAIVEVGEGFCALFVELRSGPGFGGYGSFRKYEFFLGLCNCVLLHEWRLCSPDVADLRPEDCTFQEGTATTTTDARVHRRLCDVTGMVAWNKPCNCSETLADKPLYKVTGFPTCFQPPLPDSLCRPRRVCGVAHCESKTVFHQIHTVICDVNCMGRQPFCERLGPATTAARKITSYWSEWSAPKCNSSCGQGTVVTEATCINKVSGKKAEDCIGPGTYCCPPHSTDCDCRVHYDDEVLKVTRTLATCNSLPPCSNQTKYSGTQVHEKTEASELDDEIIYKRSKKWIPMLTQFSRTSMDQPIALTAVQPLLQLENNSQNTGVQRCKRRITHENIDISQVQTIQQGSQPTEENIPFISSVREKEANQSNTQLLHLFTNTNPEIINEISDQQLALLGEFTNEPIQRFQTSQLEIKASNLQCEEKAVRPHFRTLLHYNQRKMSNKHAVIEMRRYEYKDKEIENKKPRAAKPDVDGTIYDYPRSIEQDEPINRDNVFAIQIGNGDEVENDLLKELIDQPFEISHNAQAVSEGRSLQISTTGKIRFLLFAIYNITKLVYHSQIVRAINAINWYII